MREDFNAGVGFRTSGTSQGFVGHPKLFATDGVCDM
ncbi:hypothetical protein BVRB_3g057730 [Beta vulgaris subsp. vulgaris]|nr:hypothetical protein BVRB_3g057730 [Beta vulgaris subsp. vulgaris]